VWTSAWSTSQSNIGIFDRLDAKGGIHFEHLLVENGMNSVLVMFFMKQRTEWQIGCVYAGLVANLCTDDVDSIIYPCLYPGGQICCEQYLQIDEANLHCGSLL